MEFQLLGQCMPSYSESEFRNIKVKLFRLDSIWFKADCFQLLVVQPVNVYSLCSLWDKPQPKLMATFLCVVYHLPKISLLKAIDRAVEAPGHFIHCSFSMRVEINFWNKCIQKLWIKFVRETWLNSLNKFRFEQPLCTYMHQEILKTWPKFMRNLLVEPSSIFYKMPHKKLGIFLECERMRHCIYPGFNLCSIK